MNFYEYLKNKISGESNKEIVAKLNLFHPIFEKLDEVTFSRWINNKITPSNKKIALMVLFFEDDYINIISKLKLKPTTKVISNAINIKKTKLSDPYFSFYDNIKIHEFNNFQDFPKFHSPKVQKTIDNAVQELNSTIKKIILFKGIQTYVYGIFMHITDSFYFSTLQKTLHKGLYVIMPPTYQTHIQNHREIIFTTLSYITEYLAKNISNITIILVARTNTFNSYYESLGYKYEKKIFIDKKEYYLYEVMLIDHITSDVMIDIIKDFSR
ncbi:hypothetical protein [Photobacterium damselae]|uniref:hypothetical protein n=1 Tax=Photobacterium damselae TaxID=38293 RepID=UPI000839EC01|nr:hypothetical protein [Photobacterium damselae]ODA23995.1 hypothetical protein A0J46_05405 [Photobacterium damselae subsp. damselae]